MTEHNFHCETSCIYFYVCYSTVHYVWSRWTIEIEHKEATFWFSLFVLNAPTHLLTRWKSRDQPSLGPAVARTPPRLNSPSGRLSSRLNVVDWLRLSLRVKHLCLNIKTNNHKNWGFLCRFFTHFPKSFFMPLDFFLLSGDVGSVCVLSLLADLCGTPARSRWSVPCCSVSAAQTQNRCKPVRGTHW